MMKTARIAVALLLVGAMCAPPSAAQSIEVASVKPNLSGEPGPQFRPQSGGFTIRGITVQLLIQMAYGIQNFQLAGAPGWTGAERFDIAAKVEGVTGELPIARWPVVFQTLLADRFHLKFHRETREGAVYALTAANGGSKLEKATGIRPYAVNGLAGYISGTMDIATLSNWLAWRMERPVIDKTGLSGMYDIQLVWTPDDPGAGLPPPPPPPPPAPTGPGDLPLLPMRPRPPFDPLGPPLVTAIREQLGLRLDTQRGPIDMIVIDSIEHPSPD